MSHAQSERVYSRTQPLTLGRVVKLLFSLNRRRIRHENRCLDVPAVCHQQAYQKLFAEFEIQFMMLNHHLLPPTVTLHDRFTQIAITETRESIFFRDNQSKFTVDARCGEVDSQDEVMVYLRFSIQDVSGRFTQAIVRIKFIDPGDNSMNTIFLDVIS